jgi:hypothetical protein
MGNKRAPTTGDSAIFAQIRKGAPKTPSMTARPKSTKPAARGGIARPKPRQKY